jgi:hypothetical protein
MSLAWMVISVNRVVCSTLASTDEEDEVKTDSDLADFALRTGGGPGQNTEGQLEWASRIVAQSMKVGS